MRQDYQWRFVSSPNKLYSDIGVLIHCAGLQIRKQSDNIYLDPIVPGSPFISEHMEDMSCLLEDNELVGATVQIQIFPAVLRHSCESDGNLSKQAGVVMKARVIAVNHLFD